MYVFDLLVYFSAEKLFLPLLSVRVLETFHFIFMVMLAGAVLREEHWVLVTRKDALFFAQKSGSDKSKQK